MSFLDEEIAVRRAKIEVLLESQLHASGYIEGVKVGSRLVDNVSVENSEG